MADQHGPHEHTPTIGLGFPTFNHGSAISSSAAASEQGGLDALAFAKRILSTASDLSSSGTSRTRTASRTYSTASYDSSGSIQDARDEYIPQAGPSGTSPVRSSSSASVTRWRRLKRHSSSDHHDSHAGASQESSLRRAASSKHAAKPSEERQALAQLVGMYESLTNEMSTVKSRQAELETNLKIARSNLALAENHAEALEDSIKRNPSRLSGTSGTIMGYSPVLPPVPTMGNSTSPALQQSSGASARSASRSPNPPPLSTFANEAIHTEHDAASAPSPRLGSFWKLRPNFGTTSHPNLAGVANQQPAADGGFDPKTGKRSSSALGLHSQNAVNGHDRGNERLSVDFASEDEGSTSIFRKPSFGMLRSSSANPPVGNERVLTSVVTTLQSQLEQSRHAYATLQSEYKALQQSNTALAQKHSTLQEEIENLSVSLFEEANTMVAEERKANSFLHQQLDQAKLEADDLQRQVTELRALLTQKERVTSPIHGQLASVSRNSSFSLHSQHRRRTSTSSTAMSHPNRSRRRSSIAALDTMEAYVSASPRSAGREMAAAAAAVKALGMSHNSDIPTMPASASASSFTRSRLSISQPAHSFASSLSAPTTAALSGEGSQPAPPQPPGMSPYSADDTTPQTTQYGTLSPIRDVAETRQPPGRQNSTSPRVTDQQEQSTSASLLRSKWFSFGSRRRPKTDNAASVQQTLPSPVPAGSPVSGSPKDGLQDAKSQRATSPDLQAQQRKPPSSPDRQRQGHAKLNSGFSPDMFKPGLPEAGTSTVRPKLSPSNTSSLASNVQHLVSPHARPGHARVQSASSIRQTLSVRSESPLSPAVTDSAGSRSIGLNRSLSAFSSPSRPRQGGGPRELILLSGGSASSSPRSAVASPRREIALGKLASQGAGPSPDQGGKVSPDTSMDIPRSPSQPRYMPVAELHSILDQISADEIPPSFSRLAKATTPDETDAYRVPLPFSSLRQQSPRAQRSALADVPPRPASQSLCTHKKSSWSVSSDLSKGSANNEDRPPSRTGLAQGLLRTKSAPETGADPQEPSPSAGIPLSSARATQPRLAPVKTSFSPSKQMQLGKNAPNSSSEDPDSAFPMPTPPAFKRFPRDTGAYRAPLHSPSKLEKHRLQHDGRARSGSGVSAQWNPLLQRSGSNASNFSFNNSFDIRKFGLQRQDSNMSVGGGSVAEDLDTLMQSIDAMNESLGLESDGDETASRDPSTYRL